MCPRQHLYGQTLDAQFEQLRAAHCSKIYREKVTGGARADRRELLKLLAALAPGDMSAHGSASDWNCAFASTMLLTMQNRSKVLRERQSIRVTITNLTLITCSRGPIARLPL